LLLQYFYPKTFIGWGNPWGSPLNFQVNQVVLSKSWKVSQNRMDIKSAFTQVLRGSWQVLFQTTNRKTLISLGMKIK
jgi:hypothetical protein